MCNHQCSHSISHISILLKASSLLFIVISGPAPHAICVQLFSHNSFFFLEFHVNEMKQYIVFCVWRVWLSMILLRFINFIENIVSYFFIYWRAVLVEWMHNNLFICLLDISGISSFELLKMQLLVTFTFGSLCECMFLICGGKNLGVIISGNLDSCLT